MNKKRILIADDEPVMRDVMKSALSALDIEIDTVDDGNEAMERINKIAYDLVITDYLMPKMDGLELIRWMKSTYPSIPVILVTGTMSADAASNSKVAACITKPFKVSEFRNIVQRILWKYPKPKNPTR